MSIYRRDAHLNLLHCETLYQRSGERPLLRAGLCGQIGCCDLIGGPMVNKIARSIWHPYTFFYSSSLTFIQSKNLNHLWNTFVRGHSDLIKKCQMSSSVLNSVVVIFIYFYINVTLETQGCEDFKWSSQIYIIKIS